MPLWLEEECADVGKMKKLLVARFKVFPDSRGVVSGEGEKLFDVRPFEDIPGLNHLHTDPDMESILGGFSFFFVVLGG